MNKSKKGKTKDYINNVCGNSDSVMYDEEDIYYSTYDYTQKEIKGGY